MRHQQQTQLALQRHHDLLQIAAEEDMMGQAHNHANRRYFERNHAMGHKHIIDDYFSSDPSYPLDTFRRRFRMERDLFLRIHDAVTAHDPYFQQKQNAAHKEGLSSIQKITASIRMLAYGESADVFDEYIRIGETTANESMKRFCRAIVEIFSSEYLRKPNADDIQRLLAIAEERGFPGMLGSIDCMHWRWKNCPSAWAGQYSGYCHEPTIVLEAVASRDLWIWHAFFGMPGSNNDINAIEEAASSSNPPPTMSHDLNNTLFSSFVNAYRNIKDREAHFRLKENLIEHLWARRGTMD